MKSLGEMKIEVWYMYFLKDKFSCLRICHPLAIQDKEQKAKWEGLFHIS